MRQARASRRGLSRGIQRHSIGSRHQQRNTTQKENSPAEIQNSLHLSIENVARFCFEKTFSACTTLCLIQLVQDPNNCARFKLASPRRRRIHGVVLLIVASIIARNMWITLHRLATVGMDSTSAICLCGS